MIFVTKILNFHPFYSFISPKVIQIFDGLLFCPYKVYVAILVKLRGFQLSDYYVYNGCLGVDMYIVYNYSQ